MKLLQKCRIAFALGERSQGMQEVRGSPSGRSECGGARRLNLTLKFIDEYASSDISSEVFFVFI
ncbi:hypothetical protein BK133_19395 [Paenibacillus sp. FSL H8-0548]|nr:hypothetical protein BK133_19395 [Paenibacillus sp. FSL H8-0548]